MWTLQQFFGSLTNVLFRSEPAYLAGPSCPL